MTRSIAAVLSVLALEACATGKVLEPAAGAALGPGHQNVAEASAAGVTVKVTGDSWNGDPKDLGALFTPVRVSYRDFTLAGGSGFHYAATPQMKARGTLSAGEAPRLQMARWWPEKLPTQDMLSEALPEGAVQDGGSVSGFVYFQSVTGRESAVQFEMNVVDANNGKPFGAVAIPFQTMADFPAAPPPAGDTSTLSGAGPNVSEGPVVGSGPEVSTGPDVGVSP